ncbi:hypothetical protein J5N97_012427 [Dioscorea zingiberensis]|uniref:Dirigent protein n=1 Tax=Dioscorea zingiberensis TaxID=325984 RepID=A0A9D5HHT8_9LILI|nr:hypothetical protein J5N97_012427 [Dioscorea zingiberensis]
MASSMSTNMILVLILLCAMAVNSIANFDHLPKEEETYLNFYLHYNFIGSNTTAVSIVKGPTNKPPFFGNIIVSDSPMTTGPRLESKLIGRGQGFSVGVSKENFNFLNTINLAFIQGSYKGSSLTIQLQTKGEVSVIGGTGRFRLARGFGNVKAASFPNSLKFNVFVLHASC